MASPVKRLVIIGLFIVSAFGGVVFSSIVTLVAWNIQIEPRAFQCTDSMWPLVLIGWIWTRTGVLGTPFLLDGRGKISRW
jgi:hypothetical protein